MKHVLAVAGIMPLLSAVAFAGELRVFGHLESYGWKEKLQGRTVVEEEGHLSGAGMEYTWLPTNQVGFSILGDLFTGRTDYEGGILTEDGTFIPADSETAYYGLRGEGRVFIERSAGSMRVQPEAGLGLRGWLRDFESLASDDLEDAAYQEYWFDGYGFLGLFVRQALATRNDIHARARLKVPLWTREYVDLSNTGGPDDVKLEPEAQFGWQAEIGATIRGVEIDAFVERFEYDQSDLDREYDSFFQPDSEAWIIGGRIGARI